MSGATALAAAELTDISRMPGTPSNVVFDDVNGMSAIRAMIQGHRSWDVDNYILDVGSTTPQVHTALILGPVIYGESQGPCNRRSIQIPELARATLKRGRGLQVGEGLNRWTHVHITDLGDLFVRLVQAALEDRPDREDVWNTHGVHLVGVGEMVGFFLQSPIHPAPTVSSASTYTTVLICANMPQSFAEISRRVTETVAAKKWIASGEIDKVYGSEANILLPHGTILYDTNARGKARRAWSASDGNRSTATKL